MNLGRFQPGQDVPIRVSCVDGSGNPAWPDAAPIVTITNSSDVVIFSGPIALDGSPYGFSLPVFLGVSYILGTYQAGYAWSVLGANVTATDTFDVISGGDVGGSILSMYCFVRPEATYVVAQLTSGNIVQGRNPQL